MFGTQTFSWQSHWPWPAGTSAASSASLPSTPACGQHVLTLFSACGGMKWRGGEETLHWCAIEEVSGQCVPRLSVAFPHSVCVLRVSVLVASSMSEDRSNFTKQQSSILQRKERETERERERERELTGMNLTETVLVDLEGLAVVGVWDCSRGQVTVVSSSQCSNLERHHFGGGLEEMILHLTFL